MGLQQGYLLDWAKPVLVSGVVAAGTTTIDTSSVDMAENGGWDAVLFVCSFGTPATDNLLKGSQSADDSTFNVLTPGVVPGASDESMGLDIQRPVDRYMRASIERGTSTTMEACWAFRYRSRDRPVTSAVTNVFAEAKIASPAEV